MEHGEHDQSIHKTWRTRSQYPWNRVNLSKVSMERGELFKIVMGQDELGEHTYGTE